MFLLRGLGFSSLGAIGDSTLRTAIEPGILFFGMTNPAFAPNIDNLGGKDGAMIGFGCRAVEDCSSFAAIWNRSVKENWILEAELIKSESVKQ